jgi:translocator protein
VALIFSLLALAGSLVQLVCSIMVLIHAFQKSVGTGFMCLCIPCYIVYYMHTEFEHESKSMIIAGFWGGVAVNALMQGAVVAMGGGGRRF